MEQYGKLNKEESTVQLNGARGLLPHRDVSPLRLPIEEEDVAVGANGGLWTAVRCTKLSHSHLGTYGCARPHQAPVIFYLV